MLRRQRLALRREGTLLASIAYVLAAAIALVPCVFYRAFLDETVTALAPFERPGVRQSQHRRGSRQVVIGDQIDLERARAPAPLA